MKVYEAIAKAILAEGTTSVFALLGDTNMELLGSLERLGFDGIEHVRHEGAAVAEADGYARASGRVGVCTVTAGPGLTNTISSLTGAVRAHAPMVLFTGQHSRDDLDNIQWIDHEGLVRLTGAAYRPISSPGAAMEATRAAFYQAATERRPVVLDVPADVQAQEYTWDDDYLPSALDLAEQQRPRPDPDLIAAAVDAIAAAKRPVIIAGDGARRAGAVDGLRQLGEATGALLASTLLVRGLFDDDPYDIGVAGLFSTPIATELLGEADLVLAFGASMNHFTTESGYLFPNAAVLQFDVRAQVLMGTGRRADHLIVGDALASAEALLAALAQRPPRGAGFRIDDVMDRLRLAGIDNHRVALPPGLADPRAICEELDRALPEECGLVIGAAHFWAFPIMHMRRRRSPQLFTFQFGCIGQALPIGVGAALGNEGQPIAVIEGDGSLMMGITELERLAVRRPKLLVVVLNDAALGAEYHKLRAKGFDPGMSISAPTDLARLAAAFGCPSMTITDAAEIKEAVERFRSTDGPLLLDCRTSRDVVSAPFRRLHFGQE